MSSKKKTTVPPKATASPKATKAAKSTAAPAPPTAKNTKQTAPPAKKVEAPPPPTEPSYDDDFEVFFTNFSNANLNSRIKMTLRNMYQTMMETLQSTHLPPKKRKSNLNHKTQYIRNPNQNKHNWWKQ
jgi:hypothetical protein